MELTSELKEDSGMPELLEDGRIEDEQKRLSTEGIDGCGAVLSIRVEAVHFGVEDDGPRLLDTKAWQGSGRGHDNGDDTATTTGGRAREGESVGAGIGAR